MSLKNKLPKAPSALPKTDTFKEEEEVSNMIQEQAVDQEVSQLESKQELQNEIKENTPVTAPANIRPELMDTAGFEETLATANRARALAARYTKLAENGTLPNANILAADQELAKAIQDTLIEQAEKFDGISRTVLKATLEDTTGEAASTAMKSAEVKTVNGLYDIAFSKKQ